MGSANILPGHNDIYEDFVFTTPHFQSESTFKSVPKLVSDVLLSSVEWVYTTTESVLAYDYKLWYLWNGISNLDEGFDMFFNQYWALSLSTSIFQLFYAVILDRYLSVLFQNTPYTNDWFRMMLHSKETALIWLYHPELSWHINGLNQFFTYFYGGILEFVYFDKSNPDMCILVHTLWIQLLILFLIFTGFVTILFSFYGNPNTEENTIDSDYLAASGTVEAEKEITSIDDYLGLVFTIAYVFGIFFYVHGWTSILSHAVLLLSCYSIIIMFLFILGMPTLLLYDFGIFFLAYLKGAGKYISSIAEMMFDYTACLVFYIRILAQWIRVVLMVVTFISLSHYVSDFDITNSALIGSENQSDSMNELNTNFSMTYYILTVLPGKFLYWIYEILHTFFVVCSQFVAFFAIVFWLFLFLYTFFIIEKHEDFFSKKREDRKKKLKELWNLKN